MSVTGPTLRRGPLSLSTVWASIPLATAIVAMLALGAKLVTLVDVIGWPSVVAVAVDERGMADLPELLEEAMLLAPEPEAGPAEAPPAVADAAAAAPSCPTTVQGLEDVAADLMQRRETIAAREGRLDLREAALAEAESQLARRADELDQLRRQLQEQLGKLGGDDDARIAQLVKVYETMKPKQAAEVFDRLDLELLTRVASRMREVKMAAVLAAMDPEKARKVTVELARRRSPAPAGPAG
jgi:flagellar motility protein MotE (MotC chaperone)